MGLSYGEPMGEATLSSRRVPPALRAVLELVVLGLAAFYLVQYWRLKPTDTDDGLILDYIHQMSRGARPHWDMVDAYGLFNWVFPVLFYKLAGQSVWGIHLWLLVLKVTTIWASYRLVARVANPLYGACAGLWLMALLGQGWQPLQTPYAFLTVVPLVIGTWYALLVAPFRRYQANAIVAGLLTTLAIWTKLNTGLYLFAGGLYASLCWVPERESPAPTAPETDPRRLGSLLKVARIAGAVVYAFLFAGYVRSHYEFLYFVYLLLPLVFIFGWAIRSAWVERVSAASVRQRWGFFVVYLGCTAGLSLLILFGYYGPFGIPQYARELSGILTTIRYHYPFPPVGKPWFFVGYNENYWPELPWAVTLLFAVWLALGRRFGPTVFGSEWETRQKQVSAAVLLLTLHCFVLYPRSDDMHLFQALLLAVPALFVVLYQVEAFVRQLLPALAPYLRPALGIGAAVYASTLMFVPSFRVLTLRSGDYLNPRLRYLDYRPPTNPRIRSFAPDVNDRVWDATVDQAARYVDEITEENEPILVLCDVRFMNFASRTTQVGGRYGFYFYLIAVQLLDRAGFDKLVPPTLIHDIMRSPPRVIVTRGDLESFVPQFPELREFRDRYYAEKRQFPPIHVYELKPGARDEISRAATP